MLKNFHKNKYNSGMTLVELIVVLLIFAIITSVVMFSYSKFNSSMSLQNLADDIALTVRKAQSYAIGVQGLFSDNSFFNGYGVHFRVAPVADPPLSGSNKSFVFFVDISATGDQIYNYGAGSVCDVPTPGNECLELITITSADRISAINIFTTGSPIEMDEDGSLDISFTRPNPEATFCYKETAGPGGCSESTEISYVEIKVLNPRNEEEEAIKTITVTNTGQISVN